MASGSMQRPEPGEPSASDADVRATSEAPHDDPDVINPDVSDPAVATQDVSDRPPEGPIPPQKAVRKNRRGFVSFVQELPVLLLIAFVLALLIKTFLVQAFYIPSESMEQTLNVGDRVLVNKVVYHLHPPRRGDIIVFADPNPAPQPHRNPVSAFWHWLTEGLGVATSPEKDFIKRVIGLPGDRVECRAGGVYVNGERLNEPYITVEDDRQCGPYDVPANSLFVMGDNRLNSRDSRYGLGFIPYDKVIGRAFVIIWPPSHMGWLRGS